MPGDLQDPEVTPWHYDPRYDNNGTRPIEFVDGDLDDCVQSIAFETTGVRLNQDKLDSVKKDLEQEGFLHRNLGDDSLRQEVINKIKALKMAKKVVLRYAKSK